MADGLLLPSAFQRIGLRRCPSLMTLLAYLLAALPAGAQTESPAPPPLTNERYTEDYGYLRSPDPTASEPLSPWGPLKYIPLGDAGDVFLTLGAEFRLRYEWYGENNWGEGPQDDDGYLWARALPIADLHVGEQRAVFRTIDQRVRARS